MPQDILPTTIVENNNFEYALSIRIVFPEAISKVIKQEKDRFVFEYGSKYKSEPHITLYLTRYTLDRNTKEGFPELIRNLQKLPLKSLEISLLDPKIIVEKDRHRNLYVIGVSSKKQLQELRNQVYIVADQYRRTLLGEKKQERDKELEPHITLGEIDFDRPQAELAEVEKNVRQVIGEKVAVSSIVVFFYVKGFGREKMTLVEEVKIPF